MSYGTYSTQRRKSSALLPVSKSRNKDRDDFDVIQHQLSSSLLPDESLIANINKNVTDALYKGQTRVPLFVLFKDDRNPPYWCIIKNGDTFQGGFSRVEEIKTKVIDRAQFSADLLGVEAHYKHAIRIINFLNEQELTWYIIKKTVEVEFESYAPVSINVIIGSEKTIAYYYGIIVDFALSSVKELRKITVKTTKNNTFVAVRSSQHASKTLQRNNNKKRASKRRKRSKSVSLMKVLHHGEEEIIHHEEK